MNPANYVPSPRSFVREQVDQVEQAGTTDGVLMQGRPIVVVSMQGARSGALRKVPLMRVEHAGRYALVGSQGGSPKHPLWVHNLRAHPEVTLQDGDMSMRYHVREVSGTERDEWWTRSVDAFPPYASYQEKTDRLIPVFVLEEI
ncbi:MAG: nitroreductase family deazaflavin-dependent oxidoreductase [Intrasporangium sp.]|uniref:nitroreductase family deazaflavin-dependent oxidoreductase n=1 Tax=Intrasporangium sp. TaxID=1925024 RepID=UPI003F8228B0